MKGPFKYDEQQMRAFAAKPLPQDLTALAEIVTQLLEERRYLRRSGPARLSEEETVESLKQRIEKNITYCPVTGCHLWTGSCNRTGYGVIYYATKGRAKLVTRTLWQLVRGVIPAGLGLLHSCDTPSCCNLDHLRLGTQYDNAQDALKRSRTARKLTDEQIATIRASTWKPGLFTKLGREFGVSRNAIAHVYNGTTFIGYGVGEKANG